jgi:hypothetical protein
MTDNISSPLLIATQNLYAVFRQYTNSGKEFCGFCYTAQEIKRITCTELDRLDSEDCRKLLWETADHWESTEVYRHYLPRILESIGPPLMVKDLYPEHLFETLISLNFSDWPENEKKTVLDYLGVLESFLRLNDVDRVEWGIGFAKLSHGLSLLDTIIA